MKTYTDSIVCPHCGKEFIWKYIDDGHRPWMKGRHITITSHVIDKTISFCTHKVDYKTNSHYFIAQCTHCHEVVSFLCSEDISKELSS